jgi:LysR family glycine cleavage system transcriptional activator
MTRRIPPLNPLRVFEVVARTQNLTAAAQELHVSQSAVSRQISTLETYLGVELFRRERHGVTLTRVGNSYAGRIIPAFEEISIATEKLLRSTTQGVLRVRTYTTFTAKWLIPRLPNFRDLHPDIEVVISNAVPEVDFDRDPVDLAIQFGDGRWPRVQLDLLFPDEIEPVCSPSYLTAHLPKGRSANTLLRHRLLMSHYRSADWHDWLEATGRLELAEGAEKMRFSTSVLTWQAALDGLGIAIGQASMLESEFRQGTLVRPFKQPISSQRAYYLVRPLAQRYSRKVDLFRDWLLRQSHEARVTTNPPFVQKPAGHA